MAAAAVHPEKWATEPESAIPGDSARPEQSAIADGQTIAAELAYALRASTNREALARSRRRFGLRILLDHILERAP